MKAKVKAYIQLHHMLAPGDGVLIGLSGGADSVCLLHLLWCLKKELGFELRAVHVHHGLRGEEADRDAEFSRQLCKRLGVPMKTVWANVAKEASETGTSLEEAGRQVRYRILEEEAGNWEQESALPVKIAVAHHGDDNAETVLYHLFRGSGLKGLGGIAPVRGRLIRPLLCCRRSEVLEYLKEKRMEWKEDSTNAENAYTRNKIRNRLLPMVTEEINAQAVSNILRAADWMGQADRYFERMADQWLDRHGKQEKEGEYGFPIVMLAEEEPMVRGYIIRRALERLSCPLKDITARHVEETDSLLEKDTGKTVMLPHGLRAEREYGMLWLRCSERAKDIPESEELSGALKMRIFPCENWEDFPRNQYTKWFDYDRIKGTLSVRIRQPGDYITLPGGGRKTVKSFMIDEKIPRGEREQIPLLAEGSHILWIVGRRISEYYKVTEHTKTVLEVHADGGKESGR